MSKNNIFKSLQDLQDNINNLIYTEYKIQDLNKFKSLLNKYNKLVNNDIFNLNCSLIYYDNLNDDVNFNSIIKYIFKNNLGNDKTISIILRKNSNNLNINQIYNLLKIVNKKYYLLFILITITKNEAKNYKMTKPIFDYLSYLNKDDLFIKTIIDITKSNNIPQEYLEKKLNDLINMDYYDYDYTIFINNFYNLTYKNYNNKNIRRNVSLLHRKLFPKINYKKDFLKKNNNKKIKIGFISTHFKLHSVCRDRSGIILNLSKDYFDINILYFNKYENDVYFNNLWNSDNTNILLEGSLDNYINIINNLNLDILIYCDLGMAEKTYLLAHCRLSKIQITTWGHSETSGIDTIDYYISSSLYENEKSQNHYSEKLILHKSLCTYYYDELYNQYYEKRIKNLDNFDYILYSQYLHKLSEHDFNLFIDLFDNIKDIKLIFIDGCNQTFHKDNLNNKLSNYKDRFLIKKSQTLSNFYSLIKNSLFLIDSYPHGGCNTSLECFYFNKIVLTKPSEYLRGRFTLGFYKKMDILDFIMEDNNDFIEMSKELISNKEKRINYEKKISEKNHLLFKDKESVLEWQNTLLLLSENKTIDCLKIGDGRINEVGGQGSIIGTTVNNYCDSIILKKDKETVIESQKKMI